MYPGTKIWDLTPEGGGPPVEVIVGSAKEAIARDPKRYSLTKPDAATAPKAKPESGRHSGQGHR